MLIQHDVDEEMFFLKVDKKFPTIQRLVENYCHKTEDSYVFLLENPSKGMLDCDFPEYKVRIIKQYSQYINEANT